MGLFKKEKFDPIVTTERAFEALSAGNLKEAEKLAAQLKDVHYSSCFEIRALVELRRERPDAAIEVLREGVEAAPAVWLLWQLLGNTLSDRGDYDEAMRCYESALQLDLDEDSRGSLEFNRATLLSRQERGDEALEVVRQLERLDAMPPYWQWRIRALELSILSDLGQSDELIEKAQELRDVLEAVDWVDEAFSYFDSLLVAWKQGGFALLRDERFLEAREWATRALVIDRTDADALQLLRTSDPDAPTADRYYYVMLEGDWQDENSEDNEVEEGFFTTLEVIARSEEEAVELALQFESPRWETPLKVNEVEFGDECDFTAIGLWGANEYHTFPKDDDGE
jgi:tetratricopeptide (TPR) repeat protein